MHSIKFVRSTGISLQEEIAAITYIYCSIVLCQLEGCRKVSRAI